MYCQCERRRRIANATNAPYVTYWVKNNEIDAALSESSSIRSGRYSGNNASSQKPVPCPAPCDSTTRTIATGVKATPIAIGDHQYTGGSKSREASCVLPLGSYGFKSSMATALRAR